MKIFKFFIPLIFLTIFISCAGSKSKSEEIIISDEKILNDIREFDKNTYKNEDPYKAYCIENMAISHEDDLRTVYVNTYNQNYSFDDGIFKMESGYSMPMALLYKFNEDNYNLLEIKIPRDGSEYFPSLVEMTGGDEDLARRLSDLEYNKDVYDLLMESLKKDCEEKGLSNFTYDKIENIPGYESDVVYLKKAPEHIESTTYIAKKDEYERAKLEEGKTNWTYCDAVLYHKKTGIAVKTIYDGFKTK